MATGVSWQAAARKTIAVLAAVGWSWAVALLSTREHLTALYTVLSAAPPLWGFFAMGNASLLAAASAGTLLGVLCYGVTRKTGRLVSPPTRWLLVAWVVPLADLARLLGWEIPHAFLEPILIAGITGAAVRAIVVGWTKVKGSGVFFHVGDCVRPYRKTSSADMEKDSRPLGQCRAATHESNATVGRRFACPTLRLAAVWGLAVACAVWWYAESQQAYDDYLLGFNDFGHFAWRVANTWEGRGFLMETPGLPAFWDHFNPGLALLAPLWGLWPDARLFFVIQAVCLALPAPLVYAIGRRLGEPPMAAAAWAAAYLFYPVVGQFNLNCTYGWHPVSLALPLLFAAIAAMLRGWRLAAGAACLAACSFQEDVIAVLACLSLMLALAAWRERCRDDSSAADAVTLSSRLPWWGWLVACAIFLAALAAVFHFAPFSRYQVGRFDRLGGSFGDVLLSPILRPQAFWGTILRPQTAYFLLALFVPLGLRELTRGWTALLAAVVPLGVLLAWGHSPATSIAFQYTTTLVPVFFLAAMTGVANRCGTACPPPEGVFREIMPSGRRASSGTRSCGAALAALAACATSSTWFGAMPWSQPTLTDVVYQTYPGDSTTRVIEDRKAGSPGNAALNKFIEQVSGPQSSVLATGRVASHLLGVRRLDTVAQAGDRWQQFQAEIGPDRSPIELFDFVVLDTAERFYQSPEQSAFIIDHARRAGYRVVAQQGGIIVRGRASE